MFCPNCGAPCPDGAAFCASCGANLDAQNRGPAREPVLEQDPNLPEGIFRDEQGAYHWVYHLNMLRNPVLLMIFIKIMAYTCGGMAVLTFFGSLFLGNNTLEDSIKGFAIVFFGIGGSLILITCMVYFIVMKLLGEHYTVEHRMTEDRVEHLQTQEEKAQSEKRQTAIFVLGMLSGDLPTAGLAAAGQSEMVSNYADVKKLIASRRHDLIKVNNILQHNHIYALPHQYEFVWNYLMSHCPNAKIRG